jgi:hypothetical protein
MDKKPKMAELALVDMIVKHDSAALNIAYAPSGKYGGTASLIEK